MEYTLTETLDYSTLELRLMIRRYPARAGLYKAVLRAKIEYARAERLFCESLF